MKENFPIYNLTFILAACKLYDECKTGEEINENCWYEKLISYLTENNGDDFVGYENLFELIMPNDNKVINFQIFKTFTMTIIRLSETINKNLEQFRNDFQIERFFRIRDVGTEKCYVILSKMNLFWVTSSYDNFLDGSKKLKLIDGKRTGTFIWVRLKNLTVWLAASETADLRYVRIRQLDRNSIIGNDSICRVSAIIIVWRL